MNKHFTFHPERCTGCGACVMACINEKGTDIEKQAPYRLLKRNEYGDGGDLRITWFVHGCIHCADHPCAEACPRNCFSLDKETGTVQLDSASCVGCRRCERACPFEAIQQVEKRAAKCDGCLRRLRRGQLPLCVQACPRQALTVDEKNQVVLDGLARLQEELAEYRRRERDGSPQ
ncbi:MAG: 4Fe-4S dicluster domain-containing protein [Oscillospiraceae bacterium]|nr:4Fe-4S dicluster domain-containing protein [Oscillospiraceae bacterium]